MSDLLDILDGLAVGLVTMAVSALIIFAGPWVLYVLFSGLYEFWSAVGVM